MRRPRRPAREGRRGRATAGWTSTRSPRGCAPADVGTVVATLGTTALGRGRRRRRDRRPVRRARRSPARGRGVRRVLHADRRRGRPGGRRRAVRGRPARRLGGGRPPQARAAALRVRLGDLRRPRRSGRLYAHDSPYTYFTSSDLHLGEISLECSRSGASAAALWATLRALPLTRDGLGQHVAATRAAAGIAGGAAWQATGTTWPRWWTRSSTSSARSRGFPTRVGDQRVRRAGLRRAGPRRMARGQASPRHGSGSAGATRGSRQTRRPSPCCGAAC